MRRYLLPNRLLGICIFGCGLIMLSCVLSCDVSADVFVLMNTYYEGDKFWSHSVSGIGTCAKLCMRMTKCASFNFDFSNQDCDMNSDLLENNPHLGKSKRRSVYSRIKDWPKQLDPECFLRPCKADEVCIPNESTKVPAKEGKCIAVRASKSATLPEKSPTSDRRSQESNARGGKCYKASQIMSGMGQSSEPPAAPHMTVQESTFSTPATDLTASESTKVESTIPSSASQDSTSMATTACDSPQNPQHGQVTINEGKANYSCDPCYILRGETTRACLPNGQWEGAAPTCTIETHTADNSKYFFFRCLKKWEAAKKHCIAIGSHLVEIESEAENNFLCDKLGLDVEGIPWGTFRGGNSDIFISDYLDDEKHWLIGGDLNEDIQEFVWDTTGTVMDTGYTNWLEGEPSSYSTRRKVQLFKTNSGCGWDVVPGRRVRFFICEQETNTE